MAVTVMSGAKAPRLYHSDGKHTDIAREEERRRVKKSDGVGEGEKTGEGRRAKHNEIKQKQNDKGGEEE